MKLFAQCGYGLGDKVLDGGNNNLINGAIFGCKDINPEKLNEKVQVLLSKNSDFEILLDPQFFISLQANNPNVTPGKLVDWPFFRNYRRGQLELTENVDKAIKKVLESENSVYLTSFISPNIYISKSFDSIEAVIAKNFIRRAKKIGVKVDKKKEIYVTLAFSKESLLQSNEFEDFLNDITALEEPPDGFYIIVGTSISGASEELYHSEILSNWMLLSHVLKINGFKVINGYSDIFTPFLGIAGAYAGATGWWGTVQIFSLERFFASSSPIKNQPLIKYLSIPILKRISHRMLTACENLYSGRLINNSSYDKSYLGDPDELKRNDEILQTWDALKNLNRLLIKKRFTDSFSACKKLFLEAERNLRDFENIINSDTGYIEEMDSALSLFKEKASL